MSDEALNKHLDWLDECAEEQMTEHVCEWELKAYLYVGVPIFDCKIKGCHEKLTVRQAESRINATSRLSADRVKSILEDRKLYSQDILALHEYADTLEGKC